MDGICRRTCARGVMVAAPDLGSGVERREGSSPFVRTLGGGRENIFSASAPVLIPGYKYTLCPVLHQPAGDCNFATDKFVTK